MRAGWIEESKDNCWKYYIGGVERARVMRREVTNDGKPYLAYIVMNRPYGSFTKFPKRLEDAQIDAEEIVVRVDEYESMRRKGID